jgi:hypothetical protein
MSFFNNIISLNNFFFFLILAVVLIASFKYGRKICIALILATYPTILIFSNLAFLKLGSNTAELIILGLVYVLSLSILWTNLTPGNPHNTTRKLIDYSLLSVSFMILLAGSMAHSLKILNSFVELGTLTTTINSYIPYGFALIIPILAILITNKRSNY